MTGGSPDTRHARRAILLLLVAVLLGSGAAVLLPDALPTRGGAAPPGVVALVNGAPIREGELRAAIGAIAADRRDPVTEDDLQRALDRLIEEELLVQEGLARGLPDTNRRVREAMVRAMLASILAESRSRRPSEQELERYYGDQGSERNAAAPTSGAARDLVEAAWVRDAEDAALSDYIEALRADADIVAAPDLAP